MKCQLRGYNLKAFSRSVRLLSKLSNEVLIIADNNKLKLQAINEFKTLFVGLEFERQFFASFECQTETKCKIPVKSLILVFRVINIEKIVNTCTMIMCETMPRVVFELNCRFEVTREYFLPYMESSGLRYSSNFSQTNPSFKVEAKVFHECLQNFSCLTKDTTIWLTPQQVLFKSYYDDTEDQEVTTSFSYKTNCFRNYHINDHISATFNLKDLRSFVDFALFGDQIIDCYFEASGKPIEFTISTGYYSARMMLATHDFPDDYNPIPPSLPDSADRSMSLISSGDVSISASNIFNNDDEAGTSGFSSLANSRDAPRNHSMNLINDEDSMFNSDEDEILDSAASQVPPTIRDNTQNMVTIEDIERMTPEELERFHNSILNGNGEDSDNSIGEILVPDSDEDN